MIWRSTKTRWRISKAGIAQLVEHHLAKVEVASSSLVSRSNFNKLLELIITTLFRCFEPYLYKEQTKLCSFFS